METFKFKTNIKCGGCVAAVTPGLNGLHGIENWKVDLESADKVLTVEGKEGLTNNAVKDTLKKAGYNAEVIS